MQDINEELKELLLDRFFQSRKRKPILKVDVIRASNDMGFNVSISDDFRQKITDEDMEELDVSIRALCGALVEIFRKDAKLIEWVAEEKAKDCENCDKKEECQEFNEMMKNRKGLN